MWATLGGVLCTWNSYPVRTPFCQKGVAESDMWPLFVLISFSYSVVCVKFPSAQYTSIHSHQSTQGVLLREKLLVIVLQLESAATRKQKPRTQYMCTVYFQYRLFCYIKESRKLESLNVWLLQIRERFDSGQDVELTDDMNPHDVACLLKEFFRSLPEPLLTRDLYHPFLATRSKPLLLQPELLLSLFTCVCVRYKGQCYY